MAALPPNLNFVFHLLGIQPLPMLCKVWPYFTVEGLNLNFILSQRKEYVYFENFILMKQRAFVYLIGSPNRLCFQSKHLFWGQPNKQPASPHLQLKVLSFFLKLTHSGAKDIGIPEKKALEALFFVFWHQHYRSWILGCAVSILAYQSATFYWPGSLDLKSMMPTETIYWIFSPPNK